MDQNLYNLKIKQGLNKNKINNWRKELEDVDHEEDDSQWRYKLGKLRRDPDQSTKMSSWRGYNE